MLEQIFIKDYKNTSDPVVRHKYANTAGFFGIFTNMLLGVFKLIIGLASNSVSIMADAVNNITDMATSALTIAGFKLAAMKPDKEHPYGHARYEYVIAFVISLFMLVMGCIFVKESVVKIIHPEDLEISRLTYIILAAAVVGKLLQYSVYKRFSKAIKSTALEATALDSRNDIITTTGILISMIIMSYFKINIDAYVGFAVSLLVVISSVGEIKESLEPIIGIVPTKEQVNEIAAALGSYPIVKGFHDLVIHNYGINNDFVTVHCEVDQNLNICDIHDEIDRIEMDLNHKFGYKVTIHMDPVDLNNPILFKLKDQVNHALNELNSELTFHDFRIVEGPTHINCVFDVVVPQDKDYKHDFLADYLKERVHLDKRTINFVMNIDRPYC